ncbi:uncharacterized protein JCM15063_005387 [Sporobolomyces koalae]|uniref:uncharacterized protein n=1 Tax=Sporobolomyces koalae TaxID=500713 RepID=UPI0031819F2B
MPSLASSAGSSLHFLSQQHNHPTSTFSRDSQPLGRSLSSPLHDSSSSLERTGRYASSDDESSSPSSSPERNPTLALSTSALPTHAASPKRTAGGMTSPTIGRDRIDTVEVEEDDDEGAFTPLPSSLPRPKTKADRERERSLGLNAGPGKKDSLAKKVMRKRADSLKWAKYATSGAFEVELDLSNDELKRN